MYKIFINITLRDTETPYVVGFRVFCTEDLSKNASNETKGELFILEHYYRNIAAIKWECR